MEAPSGVQGQSPGGGIGVPETEDNNSIAMNALTKSPKKIFFSVGISGGSWLGSETN